MSVQSASLSGRPQGVRLSALLDTARVVVDVQGASTSSKGAALELLASLLATPLRVSPDLVLRTLHEREELQSTGIGDGVAIPHSSLNELSEQVAAVVICPQGLEFDAIDGQPVYIVVGVIGPKRATGEHLRILAKISRVLRDEATRSCLRQCQSSEDALRIIADLESTEG